LPKTLVEYEANLVSYFDPTYSNVSGKGRKLLLLLWDTLTPPHNLAGFTYDEKSVGLLKVNLLFYSLRQRLVYIRRDLRFYNMLKHKNDEGCPHSKNALTIYLGSPRGDMPQASTFPQPRMTQLILIPIYRSSQCEGSTRELSLPCRKLFATPPCVSMPSFLLGISADWQLS
jgi:hypothetical protein